MLHKPSHPSLPKNPHPSFEFIAVDNNNQSSEISKLIVNKGIVNYSRELKFSNLKCVSRITGAEINGTNGLPIVEFEVNNRTNELYNVGGTDLGIVWELQPGHYGLIHSVVTFIQIL